MYKIGELSKLCQLPVKTLRFYDSEGLLEPDSVDRFTGYRYYSASKLADCNRIIALKELGFTLGEIKKHMQSKNTEDIIALINSKHTELETAASQIELQIKKLDSIRQIIKDGENIMFEMVIRSSDTLRVVAKRRIFASKEDAEDEIVKIKAVLPKSIHGTRSVIINYETEYKEKNFDLAACVEIIGKISGDCGYEDKTISFPGDIASLVCNKSQLKEAYRSIIQQLDESNYQVVGAFYEIYHDDGTVELKVPVCKLLKNSICVNDDIKSAFENDPQAVGKWELIDIVPSREQFFYGSPKLTHNNMIGIKELYFFEGGEKYWVVDGWTKGIVYISQEFPQWHTVANKYTIQNESGRSLLFVEMKRTNSDSFRCEIPELWVYEKISDKICNSADIKISDNTDYPFIPDNMVLGKWKVRDFYSNNIDTFNPNKQNRSPDRLFLLSVEFKGDGKCIYTTKENVNTLVWTKGLVLNKYSETASAYRIVAVDGKEYMILEWKSGDYSFGGGRINRYILSRP